MAPEQELQVQEKRELQKNDEPTVPTRTFLPTTDIYETDQALSLVMEMPGVDKDKIDIQMTPTMTRLSGNARASRSRRAEMLKRLIAALDCRPPRRFASQAEIAPSADVAAPLEC
jgi:HSP20 family protein